MLHVPLAVLVLSISPRVIKHTFWFWFPACHESLTASAFNFKTPPITTKNWKHKSKRRLVPHFERKLLRQDTNWGWFRVATVPCSMPHPFRQRLSPVKCNAITTWAGRSIDFQTSNSNPYDSKCSASMSWKYSRFKHSAVCTIFRGESFLNFVKIDGRNEEMFFPKKMWLSFFGRCCPA